MKRLAMAVAALLVAGLAWGQTGGDGKPIETNNSTRTGGADKSTNPPTQRTQTMTPTGGAHVFEQQPDRKWVLLRAGWLTTILCDKCGCPQTRDMDSTAFEDTRGYTRLKLRIKAQLATMTMCGAYQASYTTTDSIYAHTFAVQMRSATNGAIFDTTNTAVRSEWTRSAPGASLTDTAGTLNLNYEMRLALDNFAGSGEFVWVWPNLAGAVVATGEGTRRQNWMRDVELVGRDGVQWTADFTQLRMRALQCLQDQDAPAAMPIGKPVFITVDLYGSR